MRDWNPVDEEAQIPQSPHEADLLYIAIALRHPTSDEGKRTKKWKGLPVADETKQLMALLMRHGAHPKEAKNTQEEYLQGVGQMLKEAEGAVPRVLRVSK
ncbi:hypothetical protein DFH07DRAFT_966818 [Mycena maculata]|uniref:Uncharacterized protein n=1 Tax=Mycena maculata TaxID=230809 RepID=A0AAD7I742_9AGAR|nr:hypothetical protein DFH07DRAFT_966818 [Mycena maculata]